MGLRWSDVDLGAGQLRIEQALVKSRGEIVFGVPKTAAGRRTIPLSPSTVAALRAHRKRQDTERAEAGEWSDYDLVFPNSLGNPIDQGRLLKWLHKHLSAAGLPRIRFHDLRHSCATLLLSQGVDLKTVSSILGHSSIGITADLYAQVLPDLKSDAAQRLENAFRPPENGEPQDLWGSRRGSGG